MREFNYKHFPDGLATSETINLISKIHEYRGRGISFAASSPVILEALRDVAIVQSAEASNSIEGIRTSDKRLGEIMDKSTELKTRDEEQIAGYRDVLTLIHDNHEHMDVTSGVILQMHKMLYRYTPSSMGGHCKVGDNEIRDVRADGTTYTRFKTMPAVATPHAMEALCDAYHEGVADGDIDPLLLSLMFVFDFTCIHPFNDGNGRMSRLLTLLLMYKAGYDVGRYVSVEREIERSRGSYYDALAASSEGWNENRNDYAPFVRYMLGVINAAYGVLDESVRDVLERKLTKAQRVEKAVSESLGSISKSQIMAMLPDISMVTIERVLASLLEEGKVEKVGGGRSTAYVWRESQR